MKCVLTFIAAIFLLSGWGFAQSPAPLLQNIAHRNTVSLNGEWHYIVDPHTTAALKDGENFVVISVNDVRYADGPPVQKSNLWGASPLIPMVRSGI